jgi:hypothetical protein
MILNSGTSPTREAWRPDWWVACAALFAFQLGGCSKETPAERAYYDEAISCPLPALEQFEPWGQSGSQHTCKIKHGPFVAFEQGHVKIRGQFSNGKEVGVWRWYGPDGKVEKEIDYSSAP